MDVAKFWVNLGEKSEQNPTHEDVARFNEIIHQRKLDEKANQVKQIIEHKISKIFRQLERNVGCYPEHNVAYQLFLDSINIDEFESIQEELHTILNEIEANNKQVQSVLNLIEEFKNPQIDYTPVSLDEIEIAQPKTQITTSFANVKSNKKNKLKTQYLEVIKKELKEFLQATMLMISLGIFAWVIEDKTEDTSIHPVQIHFLPPLKPDNILSEIKDNNYISMYEFINTAKTKGILDQVLGVQQILDNLKPQLDAMGEEKGLKVLTKLIFQDDISGETYDNGVNIPLELAINDSSQSIYVTTTYVTGVFLNDGRNRVFFMQKSVEIRDNQEEQ